MEGVVRSRGVQSKQTILRRHVAKNRQIQLPKAGACVRKDALQRVPFPELFHIPRFGKGKRVIMFPGASPS